MISLCSVFPFSVLFDRFGMAVRTLFYLKRIDERYLVYRKRLVLGIVPCFAFVIDERGKWELSVKFRKRGPQRERVLVLLVLHGGLYAHRKENEDTNRQVIGFVSLPMNPIFCLFQGKKIISLKASWPATMCKPVFIAYSYVDFAIPATASIILRVTLISLPWRISAIARAFSVALAFPSLPPRHPIFLGRVLWLLCIGVFPSAV